MTEVKAKKKLISNYTFYEKSDAFALRLWYAFVWETVWGSISYKISFRLTIEREKLRRLQWTKREREKKPSSSFIIVRKWNISRWNGKCQRRCATRTQKRQKHLNIKCIISKMWKHAQGGWCTNCEFASVSLLFDLIFFFHTHSYSVHFSLLPGTKTALGILTHFLCVPDTHTFAK